MLGMSVPTILGMIISMVFTALDKEDVSIRFDKVLGGLTIKVTICRDGKMYSVSEFIVPEEMRGDAEYIVATNYVVKMLSALKEEMNKKSTPAVAQELECVTEN